MDPHDWALLSQFAAGERAALDQLAQRHERALLGLAKGLLGGSRALAEEAVQDAWVRVIASAGSFEGRSEVRTWLYRIVINLCRDIARRNRRSGGPGSESSNGHAPAEPAESPLVATPDAQEFDMHVRQAVRSLPVEQREALMLSIHAGLTDEQAADVLAIPLGTLKSRVRAARTNLRRLLAAEVLP